MPFLLRFLGLSKSHEVALLVSIVICHAMYDMYNLEFTVNLNRIWDARFRFGSFPEEIETCIKYILWTLVVLRSFTTPFYLALSCVIFWAALLSDRPLFLVPWLVTGFFKNVVPSILSLIVAVYTCIVTDLQIWACCIFILTQMSSSAFFVYLWSSVQSLYKDQQIDTSTDQMAKEKEVVVRRRKARLMKGYPEVFYESCIEEEIHLKCVSTFENLMQRVREKKGPKQAKSIDSLLQSIASTVEENEWNNMFERSHRLVSNKTIKQTVMQTFGLTDEDIYIAKIHQNEEFKRILSETGIPKVSSDDDTFLSALSNPSSSAQDTVSNDENACGSASTLESTFSNDSETQICAVVNYSTTSLADKSVETNPISDDSKLETRSPIPLPTPNLRTTPAFYFEVSNGASKPSVNNKVVLSDFGCQVSTLSRNILNSPPKEFLTFFPESTSLSYGICESRSSLLNRGTSAHALKSPTAQYCV
ncbi:hypothetical protein PPYR_13094 [Photinus pyralis]|uniref:Uncharacterized protein n=2 Tax=Photinus pyralis TaxID=7054 RepID=A0A5N4A829_PHOPY|nr:uncharacterized protein LOC116179130 [Photinus pyralis]XP_031354710.1 uncharacterized protein LOC116179135 [Photinus pyralis]KAB0793473.1 hypothetical protein PPYR_13093 [Photinus pyralis]KAB0793474.1 hypothetical protein PPYR_13094 [Photinus pyralis]